MESVAAVATALGGLGLIFASWRRWVPVALNAASAAAGWLVLLLSGWLWIVSTGAEFGVLLAFLVPSLLAWMLVLVNRQHRQRRDRAEPPALKPNAGERSWVRHLVLFVVVVPLAAVASALVTVALSLLLPWREVDAMVMVLVIMPILWGSAAYWACADSRLVRPAAALLAGSLVSAAVIYG